MEKFSGWITLVVWVTFIVMMTSPEGAKASQGDRSYQFTQCTQACFRSTCAKRNIDTFYRRQPLSEWLMRWSCHDDCKYGCMWSVVKHFEDSQLSVPQFHGKWPFIRLLGCQEPASTIFSILNGLAHVYMLRLLIRKLPTYAPMFTVWIGCGLVSVNAWVWSTVFHSRDTPITEKLDYFSALACVQGMLFVALYRFLRLRSRWVIGTILTALLIFFTHHVYYMGFIKFDYGYNMKVNVISGVVNSIIWLTWCVSVRKTQPYVWKAAAVIICTGILLLLELGDFPPVFWVFDAHSLWHGGTIGLPLLWYSFCVDDSLYLLANEKMIPFGVKHE